MLKEAVLAYFEVVSPHLPGWTSESHEYSRDGWCSGRDSNRKSPEYKLQRYRLCHFARLDCVEVYLHSPYVAMA
jgi:hypothetical protein